VRRLLRDFLIVVGLVAAGVAAVSVWYLTSRHSLHNNRPLGGPQVDVSHVQGIQSETTIAVGPTNPELLLAGSNDELFTTRVYTSSDGGRKWRSVGGPPLADRAQCGLGDPAIAIASDGHEYYAFLADLSCVQGEDLPHLFVADRATFRAEWHTFPVPGPPRPRFLFDDKPATAVDDSPRSRHRGRVYLTWSRYGNRTPTVLETSRSDDNGRTWSTPTAVGFYRFEPDTSTFAVGPDGSPYVVAADPFDGLLWIARSTDGGAHFRDLHAFASTRPLYARSCHASAFPIPAQRERCVNANPIVNIFARGPRAGQLIVTYETRECNGTQAVYAVGLDPRLDRLFRVRVNPPDRGRSDQFLPTSAIDRVTGDLWACFYDTTGDSSRTHAWYTCTVSRDGGRSWAGSGPRGRRSL